MCIAHHDSLAMTTRTHRDGCSTSSSLHLVHPAGVPDPAGAEAGLENRVELVHRVHTVVGVRLHSAHLRAVQHDLAVQEWSRPSVQLLAPQAALHRGGGVEDGGTGGDMPQSGVPCLEHALLLRHGALVDPAASALHRRLCHPFDPQCSVLVLQQLQVPLCQCCIFILFNCIKVCTN